MSDNVTNRAIRAWLSGTGKVMIMACGGKSEYEIDSAKELYSDLADALGEAMKVEARADDSKKTNNNIMRVKDTGGRIVELDPLDMFTEGVTLLGMSLDEIVMLKSEQDARKYSLPRWKCHKVVEAFKIEHILPEKGGLANLVSVETTGHIEHRVCVGGSYLSKHNPQPGGYYVRYEDGYESYSPAEVFESGYTRMDDPTLRYQGDGFFKDVSDLKKPPHINMLHIPPPGKSVTVPIINKINELIDAVNEIREG